KEEKDKEQIRQTIKNNYKEKQKHMKQTEQEIHRLQTQLQETPTTMPLSTDNRMLPPLLSLGQDRNTNNLAGETSDQFFHQLEQTLENTILKRNEENISS